MILDELNPSQRDAVLCCDAPSLVIAGAGSGKTRVLTYKIAYLLEQGMSPWNILALTFTNKAAREMKERISKLVGEEKAAGLWMGTFHSIFGRILRYESDKIGFTSDFTIYDASDSKSLIKSIIKEMGLDDKKYKASTIASHISNAKNALILPSSYRMDRNLTMRDEAQNISATGEIYERYFQKCRQSNAMDFDDMLLYTWLLLKNNPDIAEKYQERFHFVLVDEYQDTNYAQHQIVWLLTNQRQRVSVVGDDAQSIYSFRGANIDNILNFQRMYQGARLFKLEQNYRSTQIIVSAANSLIHHNRSQIRKDVFSNNEEGSKIEIHRAYSDVDESNIVVRKVRHFVYDEHMRYNQIAVLYRTNAQSRSLEEGLRKCSIPYKIFGGTSFYQRKEIKDVIAYFRLAVNHLDEEALRRVINYPARGIGATSLDKIFSAAVQHGITPWDVLNDDSLIDANKGLKTKLADFVHLINSFSVYARELDSFNCAKHILAESKMQAEIFQGTEPEDLSRQENIQELMDGIASFVDEHIQQGDGHQLTHFLQEVSLLSDLDQDDSAGDDKVTLMTVHSAKGLEFGAVIVVGMEETLFPSQMSMDSTRQIEEERRLFYVAMTRAERFLVLTHAKSRMRYGKMEFSEPSRFLSEIDRRYIHMDSSSPKPMPKQESGYNTRSIMLEKPITRNQPIAPPPGFVKVRPAAVSQPVSSTMLNNIASLSVGCSIMHDRFGLGVIEKLEGEGMDAKATVRFQNVGTKQLLLRFAKFKLV